LREQVFSFFLVIMLFSAGVEAHALNMDAEAKALCGQVMTNIYNDILEAKARYKELKNFDEKALTSNAYGIPSLHYKYVEAQGAISGEPYEFGLTIVGKDDLNTFPADGSSINLGFPLLNIKFIGYRKKILKKGQFDIETPLAKHGQLLWDYQQNYIPYKLALEPVKKEFKINEPIEFVVTLKNLSGKAILVKDLNDQTLSFLYDHKVWGDAEVAPAVKDIKDIVLKPNDSLRKRFRANPVANPRELEIYCSYILTFQGVKPSATLKIKVVE